MFRKLDSQHPYAARFIGKPFVQTVNLDNRTELEAALKFIKNNSVSSIFNALMPYYQLEESFELAEDAKKLERQILKTGTN